MDISEQIIPKCAKVLIKLNKFNKYYKIYHVK